MKPIVKWAGGKSQLLDDILPLIPNNIQTYYEPFLGGAAVYLALLPERAVLNDYNYQLINLYNVVRDNPRGLITNLNRLQRDHCEDAYYHERDTFNRNLDRHEETTASAARFLYLNKAGYNGLYRLNLSGHFNVPSARRTTVNLYDRENLMQVSEQLHHAELICGDFEAACANAEEGDFVFFDSPYYNTFDTYQAGGFSEDDHRRLFDLYRNLTNRGVRCMLTNSNEHFITDMYREFNIRVVEVNRMINCDGRNRRAEEVIITNY